jgi:uncharacterized protein YraI
LGDRKIMRLIHRMLTAAGALAVSSGVACAAPALTLSDLNMRAGPGTDSPIVVTVPGGSTVDVLGCDASGWCSGRFGRFAGYMNQAYLGGSGGPGYYGPPPPPVVYAPPPVVVYPGYLLGTALGLGMAALVKGKPFGGT